MPGKKMQKERRTGLGQNKRGWGEDLTQEVAVKKDLRQKEALDNLGKNLLEDKTSRMKARARVGCQGGEWAAVVVQSLSRAQHLATPWSAACQASLSSTIS